MRLLAQPIYRYEKPEGDLIDGALFVFVLGTDPEALLLIEAHQVDGTPRWQYGLARMSNVNLRVSDRGRPVWEVPTLPWPKFLDRSEPYTTFRIEPVEAAEKPRAHECHRLHRPGPRRPVAGPGSGGQGRAARTAGGNRGAGVHEGFGTKLSDPSRRWRRTAQAPG